MLVRGGLAQTPLFGVCDFPKGPWDVLDSSHHNPCRTCLRQIADVKEQTSAPARRFATGQLAGRAASYRFHAARWHASKLAGRLRKIKRSLV